MLVLRASCDGVVPLLGPPTSIGDVHHGAWYYYLLSPAAALTGGDSPLAVVALIALAGIAAVGVVWWLARAIGGPVAAGLVAGPPMASSAAAIDESTFIWNPNLIALSSAVALAGAWRAWSGGPRRWWLVAAVGTAVTMQCHILGVALLPVVARPVRARRAAPPAALVAGRAPSRSSSSPAYPAGQRADHRLLRAPRGARLPPGGDGGDIALPGARGIVGLRVVTLAARRAHHDGSCRRSWPPRRSSRIAVWRGRGRRAGPVRWLGLGLLWSTAFLAVAAPSLAIGHPGPAQRPLPRVRRPDGRRAGRARGLRRASAAAGSRRPTPAAPSAARPGSAVVACSDGT